MITGKLEITTKINELPQPKILENSWQQFDIDSDGRIISVTKSKVWKKLTDTASNYSQYIATITLQLGQQTDNRFVLDKPNNIQQVSFSAQA
ncbi:MAG: fertility inhibition FinO-like protein [Nostoc sp.]